MTGSLFGILGSDDEEVFVFEISSVEGLPCFKGSPGLAGFSKEFIDASHWSIRSRTLLVDTVLRLAGLRPCVLRAEEQQNDHAKSSECEGL